MTRTLLLAALTAAALPLAGHAQNIPAPSAAGWRECAALADDAQARLACFDEWAKAQAWQAPPASARAQDTAQSAAPTPAAAQPVPTQTPPSDGCRDGRQYSTLSRFWELEAGSDCGIFRFRGYQPITISVVDASNVDRQPTSGNPINSAAGPIDYNRHEMRVQLSVRTKLAQGLLVQGDPARRDSLWVAYTQQSYWQFFSPGISRPFRNTDHAPEIVYIYPASAQLPLGWRLRYGGIGLIHQSNGQSDPLSRSWNRVQLLAGMELDDRWFLTARLWKRLNESRAEDNNPGISSYVGRGEMTLGWNADKDNLLTLTTRYSMDAHGRGSVRLEWLKSLGSGIVGDRTNLRLSTQLFTGYGDSLIDYNYKRTVFSVGLSLVDF
jgi:phospholipase A1